MAGQDSRSGEKLHSGGGPIRGCGAEAGRSHRGAPRYSGLIQFYDNFHYTKFTSQMFPISFFRDSFSQSKLKCVFDSELPVFSLGKKKVFSRVISYNNLGHSLHCLHVRFGNWEKRSEPSASEICNVQKYYSDYVPKEYPSVNLDSVVEAKLDLSVEDGSLWTEEHADDFNPMNLINALKIVEILDLTNETMEMIYVFRKVIPVFENLFHVSVSFAGSCWFSLPELLKKTPNLETLVIKDSLHYRTSAEKGYLCECVSKYSFLLTCPVEVLKIKVYEGSIQELKQMKHLLEKLSCLKLVEVRVPACVRG